MKVNYTLKTHKQTGKQRSDLWLPEAGVGAGGRGIGWRPSKGTW